MRKKVMIIDDDKVFLEELNEVLISGGYDVVTVNDPVLAFNMVDKTKPDVILVDMKMPSMSGFEVANELKNFLGYDFIPIIGMSGFYRDNDISLMNMCGIQKCLNKPFRPLDVIYNIEKVMG
ncbi:MAG: response regulator [bacterium]|nr:response regulator [bacterium]